MTAHDPLLAAIADPLVEAVAQRVRDLIATPAIDVDAIAAQVAARLAEQGEPDGLWSAVQCRAYLNVKDARTWSTLWKKPGFPAPMLIGERMKWDSGEVKAYARAQRAA